MKKSIALTIAGVEALPSKANQYEVWDNRIPGLAVRVNSGGSKTFVLCRKIDGKVCRIKIGRYPAITIENARKQAIILNGQIENGHRPHEALNAQRQELIFAQLYEHYYKEHALVHTKSHEAQKGTVELHLIPHIGHLKLSSVTYDKMKKLHLSLGKDNGTYQANKVIKTASTIFNFGVREKYFKGTNPCIGIKKFTERSRDRFLSVDELQKFFEALNHETTLHRDFFMLSLFIGARKTTMLKMKYQQIDFDLKRWRISENESKNDDVNICVLSDIALEILQRRYAENQNSENPSPYVFPDRTATGHLKNPATVFKRIQKHMGVNDIRIHDLRRTFGSYMAINNASLPIIGKALNHRSQNSTAIYARLSQNPVLDAVNSASILMSNSIAFNSNNLFFCIENNFTYKEMA